jgi:hypothetical protein
MQPISYFHIIELKTATSIRVLKPKPTAVQPGNQSAMDVSSARLLQTLVFSSALDAKYGSLMSVFVFNRPL